MRFEGGAGAPGDVSHGTRIGRFARCRSRKFLPASGGHDSSVGQTTAVLKT
jgi:hypothetical protein